MRYICHTVPLCSVEFTKCAKMTRLRSRSQGPYEALHEIAPAKLGAITSEAETAIFARCLEICVSPVAKERCLELQSQTFGHQFWLWLRDLAHLPDMVTTLRSDRWTEPAEG